MVYKHFFGRTPDGQAVTRFTLFNHNTMEVNLLNYGAAVHSICVPDKAGGYYTGVRYHCRLYGSTALRRDNRAGGKPHRWG